jgi:aminoglycoside phosphotransferase (APT) family kinase protein
VREIHAVPVTEPEYGGGFVGRATTWTEALFAAIDDTIEPAAAALVRTAIAAAHLDHVTGGWCHGDLQPEHIVLEPGTYRVRAVLDWSDQGRGDPVWDIAVLTLDDDRALPAFMGGYGGTITDDRLRLYRVVRLFSEVRWLADHGFTQAAEAALARLRAWGVSASRPPRRHPGGNRS